MILRAIAVTVPFRASSELASVGCDARVICALIVKEFGRRIRPTNFWKVSIEINNGGESERFEISNGLLLVYRDLPIANYLRLTLPSQQEFLLNFIGTVLSEAFNSFGLPVREVEAALRAVRQSNFENKIVSKKWVPTKNGRMRARVMCIQKFKEAEIFVEIESGGRLINRSLIATEKPDEFIFGVWFNRLEWLSETHLRILSAHGRSIDVHSNSGDATLN